MAVDLDAADEYLRWANQHPDLATQLPTSRTRRGYQVFLIDLGGWTASVDLRGSHSLEREIKGEGTLVVLPGSVVSTDKSGNEIAPHLYEWVVAPIIDGRAPAWPAIDLRTSGLVPSDFDAKHRKKADLSKAQARIPVQGAQATQGGQVLQALQGGCGVSVCVSFTAGAIIDLVSQFPITGGSQRRSALKSMVFEIRSRTNGAKPDNATIIAIHQKWWSLFGRHSKADHDFSLLDFERMVSDLRGDGFYPSVKESMPAVQLPPWCYEMGFRSAGLNVMRLVMACDQHRNPDGTFFIPLWKADELAGVSVGTTVKVFRKLRDMQFLELVVQGTRPTDMAKRKEWKANVYRVLANPDGTIREFDRSQGNSQH